MTFLQKQYEVETSKSEEAIFAEIRGKMEAQQNKNIFWGLELINYKNFKLNDHTIEIESWPMTRVNPYEGVGTILFNFRPKEKGTLINCKIEVYNKYVSLLGSCLLTFFLLFFTLFIVITLHDHWVKALLIIVFAWTLVISISFLILRYHRNILEIYSKTILKDLGIINSRGKQKG